MAEAETEAGGRAREFPTRDPDWEPPEPGTPAADQGSDPRTVDQTPEGEGGDRHAGTGDDVAGADEASDDAGSASEGAETSEESRTPREDDDNG